MRAEQKKKKKKRKRVKRETQPWTWNPNTYIMYFSKFHDKGMFGKSLNTTFMDLISKKVGALEVKDFRPINLVSCIYKILVKVLAKILKQYWETCV